MSSVAIETPEEFKLLPLRDAHRRFMTQLADDWDARAHEFEGPVPSEVSEFIRRHRSAP